MLPNPAGFIPDVGQGLHARKKQVGTEGGKEWLKKIKLHKYWPTFSQWSYAEFMSLCQENVDEMLSATGSSGMTTGAKGRLLQGVAGLRDRERALGLVSSSARSGVMVPRDVLQYLADVVWTPLPDKPASPVAQQLITAVIGVKCYLSNRKWYEPKMDEVLKVVLKRPVLVKTMTIMEQNIARTKICSIKTSHKEQNPMLISTVNGERIMSKATLNIRFHEEQNMMNHTTVLMSTAHQGRNFFNIPPTMWFHEKQNMKNCIPVLMSTAHQERNFSNTPQSMWSINIEKMVVVEDLLAEEGQVLTRRQESVHSSNISTTEPPIGELNLENTLKVAIELWKVVTSTRRTLQNSLEPCEDGDTLDWFKPSDEKEGIWPQGENSVMFTTWPRSLPEDQATNLL